MNKSATPFGEIDEYGNPISVEDYCRQHPAMMGSIRTIVREELNHANAVEIGPFSDLFKADGSASSPQSSDRFASVYADTLNHKPFAGSRGATKTVGNPLRLVITKWADDLSVEMNVPCHVLFTSFLLGASIMALIARRSK
jgi:hypothetical protein